MYGSGEILGIMENKHGVQKGTKLKSAVFPQRFSLSWPMVIQCGATHSKLWIPQTRARASECE